MAVRIEVNEAAAAEKEELLKSMDAKGMDIGIEMNAQYADVNGVPKLTDGSILINVLHIT